MVGSKMAAFRLEPELLEGLDLAAKKLTQEHGGGMGPPWSRTDVLRYFVRRGLAELGIEIKSTAKPTAPKPVRKSWKR